MIDLGYFQVADWKLLELQQTYEPLNVAAELQKMKLWLDANPRRRKKNYNRFVIGWLNKVHAKVAVAQVNARCYAQAGRYRPDRPVQDLSAECEDILRRYPDLAQ